MLMIYILIESLKDLHKIIVADLQTLEHPATKDLAKWDFVQKELIPLLCSLPNVAFVYLNEDYETVHLIKYIRKFHRV